MEELKYPKYASSVIIEVQRKEHTRRYAPLFMTALQ